MNKKGIELATNFLVTLILSIIIFTAGIYITFKIYNGLNEKVDNYEDLLQRELEKIFECRDKVSIAFDNKKFGNKQFDRFGICINNIANTPSTKFRVEVNFDKAYDGSTEICSSLNQNLCGNPDSWLKSLDDSTGPLLIEKTIDNYEEWRLPIGVLVDKAPKGNYLFNVKVSYLDSVNWVEYNNLQVIIVEVLY